MAQAKQARRQRAIALFAGSGGVLCCPLCGKKMRMLSDGRCLCKKNHCFDLSQKGYLNLAGAGTLSGYDKALFLSRRETFAHGFFDPVLAALQGAVKGCLLPENAPHCVVDAGCGEGFYLSRMSLSGALPQDCRFFGIDLSRDAIQLAAQSDAPVCWCVANLAQMPFLPQSADVVLDVLTPANYAEFARVLKPGGAVIKVVPGEQYLQEIRALLGGKSAAEHPPDAAAQYAQAHLHISDSHKLTYTRPVLPEQALALLRMTPLTMHRGDLEPLAARLQSITVDLQILIGKKAGGV